MSLLSGIAKYTKYEALIEKIVGSVRGIQKAKVGDSVLIPEIKSNVGSQKWRFEAHKAWREE